MLSNYNKWRVLQEFFKNPNPEGSGYGLRELSRLTKIAPKSVFNYLRELERKDELIISSKSRLGMPVYRANQGYERFKSLKVLNTVYLLKWEQPSETRLSFADYIANKCQPNCVVLFGSGALGEDQQDSDLDIFIQAEERRLKDLHLYEKLIQRELNLHFQPNFASMSTEFKNNIINGIKLRGYLKVF